MKKIIAILASIVLVFALGCVSFAEEEDLYYDSSWEDSFDDYYSIISVDVIRVQNNGEYIDFADSEGRIVEPQIINDRTMVPFRKIFNSLGVTDDNIVWDGENRIVKATKDNIEIELQIDNEVAKKTISGDTTEIKLDSVPVIVDGRTLVPVRFIAESMNKKVGWDSLNRTVIIIDTNELYNDLQKSIPKFMEMANSNIKMPETYRTNIDVTGKLEYEDKKNKDNNSTLNLDGTIGMKKGTAVISLDADAKFTGKGQIYKLLEDSNFTKFTLNMIVNDNKIYLKSSLLEDKAGNKWVTTENESIKESFKMLENSNASVETLFDIQEEDMSIYTYESLKMTSQILKTLCKDEYINITEKGSTKTYTYNIDIKDFLEIYKEMGLDISADGYKGSVKTTSTYKNDVAQTSEAEIKFEYKEGSESLTLTFRLDGKVSEDKVSIAIPSDSQVIDMDEIE